MTLLFLFDVMVGVFVVLLQVLQAVLGYSALVSVTGLMPWALMMMVLRAGPARAGRTLVTCQP